MAQPNLYGAGTNSDDLQRTAFSERKKEEAAQEGPKPDKKLMAQYRREIERYTRATEKWREDGKQIEDLYLDEDRNASSMRRYALLWANVETLKPAIYAKVPTIECSRRYKDRDPVARTAAELIERATNTSFELYNVDETFQMVRDDRLLPGRGVAWVRYEADIEQYEDDEPGDDDAVVPGLPGGPDLEADAEPKMLERLAGERVVVDHVQWTEFGHNVCGTWNDAWLVWRAVYKTRDEVEDRFGKEMADRLTYDAKVPANVSDRVNGEISGENADEFCRIYELWDKRRNLTSWMTEGLRDEFIESGKPPINFSGFFPCPKPCYATKTSRSLIPRPDYIYYRDQAKEINDLTDKIANMMAWLIIKGFIPGGPSRVTDALEEVIREKSNKELFVEIEDYTGWSERGGVGKLIDWLPLDMVITAIQAAITARNQLIQDVFQITGISDILRGQTDPSETLGAQELKAQTGSRRLKNAKDEVARFCRDVGRLCAEVIAEKFEPETIAEMTGYRYVPTPIAPMGGNVVAMPGATQPPAPMANPMEPQNGANMTFDDRVIELLRNDRLRSFRIDIETDSTGQADENADKQQAMEFMGVAGQFMEKATAAVQAAPETAELMGEMLMHAIRRFRAGRTLEESIEKTFGAIAAKVQAAAQQQPQPTPEQIKAQADAEMSRQKMAIDQQNHDQQMQADAARTNADLALKNAQLAQIHAQTEQQLTEHLARMAEMDRKMQLISAESAARTAAARQPQSAQVQ
ncbi:MULTISPECIES: hypothetical protein [Rhodomicrobium]|uniref:hypothetical protein n=1 Tax=Rhodomicrobium TaxID=1068 RepID=UPI000B4A8AFC|nr:MULTISPECIES: hypothetical protein [Rhodomicrobium]